MSELLNESQLREQDYRLYGPEEAVQRAMQRQREWIERELAQKTINPERTSTSVESPICGKRPSAPRGVKDLESYL